MPNIGVAKAKKERSSHPKLQRAALVLVALILLIVVGLSLIPDPNLELNRLKAQQNQTEGTRSDFTDQSDKVQQGTLHIIHNQIDQSAAFETYVSAWASAHHLTAQISVVSGGADYSEELKKLRMKGEVPDLIYFDRSTDLASWQNDLADLSNEAWASDTRLAPKDNLNRVIGFPVSVEGYGLIYNQDILQKAGIDPAQLNNFAALQAAVGNLTKQKEKLGLESVFAYSLAPDQGMTWTNSVKLFNVYLSEGLSYNNRLMIDSFLKGSVSDDRLNQFTKFIELLIHQTDNDLLTKGSYADQIDWFAQGKAAFILESQQIEFTLLQQGASFSMGFLPIPSYLPITSGVFAKANGWYGIYQNSPNQKQARQFLSDLQSTQEGNAYLINPSKGVPAFKTLIVKPQTPLTLSLWNWVKADKIYSIWQDELPSDWINQYLTPSFVEYSQGLTSQQAFVNQLKQDIQSLNPDSQTTPAA